MSKYKLFPLDEIEGLENYIKQQTSFFSIKKEEDTILSSKDLADMIFMLFPDRKMCFKKDSETNQLIIAFSNYWNLWKTQNLDNIIKKWDVLAMEYNPIDNYDGYEKTERTLTREGDVSIKTGNIETSISGDSKTISGTSRDVETPIDLKTTTKVAGYNNSNFSNAQEIVENGRNEIEHSFQNYKEGIDTTTTETFNGAKDSIDTTDTETIEISRHGNLGQTSSQNMIGQELELRNYNLIYEIVKTFIDYATVY